MKDFIKYTTATIVGIFLCSIIMSVISIIAIAGMAASENMTKPIKEKSILRLNLNGTIEERTKDDPFAALAAGEGYETISLEEAMIAIEKAKENESIKGIYIEGGMLEATPAMLQELRNALTDFKESGKFILAYGDNYSKGAYYLASTADQVLLNPIGMLDWSGMASQPLFFKDLLEKIGVKVQVFKVGTYKSAVEPFICTEMSPANREQVNSYLSSIWKNMVNDVAASRNLKPEAVNALADSLTLLADPEVSVKGGLVDQLCYISEVKKILKEKAEIEEDESIKFVTTKDVAKAETLQEKISDEIAVYYAYGDIVDTRSSSMQQEAVICGKDVIKDLQELREDDDIKAVVIRVNSGGGSAYASEQIWHEVELLKAEKPVVISMGGMAASGGYYISCGANAIYAEPTTLTGSIGIFGMIPDASELLSEKLGLKHDVVKTNAMSDFGSFMRPFNEAESNLMQTHVNKGYELFTGRVADGRKMKKDDVKAIAEGRVWTGEQALEIGLVDKLGDLDDAIAAAAELAESKEYSIGRYPAPAPWFQGLLDKTKSSYLDSHLKELMGEYYTVFGSLQNMKGQNPIQARIPYYINIK